MTNIKTPFSVQGDDNPIELSDTDGGNLISSALPSSANRRHFLKQISALGMGAVAAPAVFHSRETEAAAQIGPADIPLSSSKTPVLEPNQNISSHLLTVDFRNQTDLETLNTLYGTGTAKKFGSLTFDSDRGVSADNSSSGIDIDLTRILDTSTRTLLGFRGQLTIEMETDAVSDPWRVDEYTDRYNLVRQAPNHFPNSTGNSPSNNRRNLVNLLSANGFGGPIIRGPMPESPRGTNTRANNLATRMHGKSSQNMTIGMHSAMHGEFTSVTVSWWTYTNFTMFVDGIPFYLAGPSAVGAYQAGVNEHFYTMNDVSPDTSSRDLIRLFFSSDNVFIRRITLGSERAWYPVHPLFQVWASYGDSITQRGGWANTVFPQPDLWDADQTYYFIRRLAAANYRAGFGWNNSLGGATYLKTASRTLWDNGGKLDLANLMDRDPTFVMMAASHNDSGYIGYATRPGSNEYQQRLAQVKADILEHIEVILTGTSSNWYQPARSSRAKIGIITTPPSPRSFGWDNSQIQAQLDLNRFVMDEVKDWVTNNLGASYGARIATYDAAALFGNYGVVDSHPLFSQDGTGIHPNWWGGNLLNEGWWQCAVQLIG